MKFAVIGGGALPEIRIMLTHSEDKRRRALKKFEGPAAVDQWGDVQASADATTDCLDDRKCGGRVYVVFMRPMLDNSAAQDAALLAHEAVHVASDYFESFGEDSPGEETRAYVLQDIAQYLIEEHYRWKKRHI